MRTITAANGSQVSVSSAQIDACRRIQQDEWNFRFSTIGARADKKLDVLFAGFGVVVGGVLIGVAGDTLSRRKSELVVIEPSL